MENKWKNIIFVLLVIVVLAIPIVLDMVSNKKVEFITFNGYETIVDSGEFALIYYGDTSKNDYNEVNDKLVKVKSEFDINVKSLNKNDLSDKNKETLIDTNELFNSEFGWAFINNGSVEFIHEGKIEENQLKKLIDKYYNNIIPDDELSYKKFENAAEFKKVYNSKKPVMVVLGSINCSWCNTYLPVFNDAAREHEIDIYYLETSSFEEKEYEKIMNMGIKIPKSCTTTGSAQDLSEGFGTPLTLFFKGGKAIDCISGYVPKDRLDAKLKSVGVIK